MRLYVICNNGVKCRSTVKFFQKGAFHLSEGSISSPVHFIHTRREHFIPVHFIHAQKGAFHLSERSISSSEEISKISINFVQSFKIISQNAKISIRKSIVTIFFIFCWNDWKGIGKVLILYSY